MRSWFQQLDRATSPAEVVAVARDYLATWTPVEIGRLPRACRPGRMRVAEDIDEMHSCAVDAYRTTRASGDELTALQLLTSFLVRASLRLAKLRETQDAPEFDSAATDPPSRLSKVRDR